MRLRRTLMHENSDPAIQRAQRVSGSIFTLVI